MGYESKIFVVKKSNLHPEPDGVYAEVIASIRLSKIGGRPACFKRPTNCFIYADDGDTHITKDEYGDPLYECSVNECFHWLQDTMMKAGGDYWRYYILDGILRGIPESIEDKLVCLHYGY